MRRFALAHPEYAPYGGAARQALRRLGLWQELQPPPPAAVPPEGTVYIHPEDIEIIYPGVPLMEAVRHTLVEGRVIGHGRRAGGHLLQVGLGHGHEVELAFQDYASPGLSLEPGEAVQLSLRRDAIAVLRPPH